MRNHTAPPACEWDHEKMRKIDCNSKTCPTSRAYED